MSQEESKIVEFLRKIGDAVLGLKDLPSKISDLRKKLDETPEDPDEKNIPSTFANFFENRNAGWPEYVMLKLQITILLLFISVTAFVLSGGSWLIFGPLLILTSFYALLLTGIQIKVAFDRDYPAYRAFVVICLGIAWTSVFLLKYFPPLFEGGLLNPLIPVMIVLINAVTAFALFRAKYGRSYTYGRVEEVKGDKVKVRVGYDLRSNVRQGTHFLESFVPVDVGDTVKVEVDRSMLGLRGSSVEAATEKVSKDSEF